MINETVPVYLLGRYGPVVSAGVACGYFLVFVFGKGLPQADYNPKLMDDADNLKALEANKEDEFWRVIYIFPMVINCLMLVGFSLFIRCDPIMFCVS